MTVMLVIRGNRWNIQYLSKNTRKHTQATSDVLEFAYKKAEYIKVHYITHIPQVRTFQPQIQVLLTVRPTPGTIPRARPKQRLLPVEGLYLPSGWNWTNQSSASEETTPKKHLDFFHPTCRQTGESL